MSSCRVVSALPSPRAVVRRAAICVVALAVLSAAASASPHFLPATATPVVANPLAMQSADFNRDGAPDLAVLSSGALSILLGHGDGTFAPRADIAISATSMAVGDLNVDGIPDIVTGRPVFYTWSMTVFLGHGDGTFALPMETGGNWVTALGIADVTSDGKPDVVFGWRDDLHNRAWLGVETGTGTGMLHDSYARQFNRSAGLTAIAIGDLNGDCHPDVVFAPWSTSAVLVLLGTGDAQFFGANQIDTTATGASSVAVGDVNGDCVPDIVVGCTASASVLSGHGDGTFAPHADQFLRGTIGGVTIGDIDGDGIGDILASRADSSTVYALLGHADGSFTSDGQYATGSGPHALVLADFNRDGVPDLATLNTLDRSVSMLLHAPAGPPAAPPCHSMPRIAEMGAVAVATGHLVHLVVPVCVTTPDSLDVACAPLPDGATFDRGVFTWTPRADQVGASTLVFTVRNQAGDTDSEGVAVVVTPNLPPVIAALGSYEAHPNVPFTLAVSASDPNGDPVTTTAAPLPDGATFDGHTFAWTPTMAQRSDFVVVFTATDSLGLSDSEAVAIHVTVDDPPVIAALPGYAVRTGSRLTFRVSTSDPDGDVVTCTADPLPTGASFYAQSFQWTPTADQAGAYVVMFTATDPFGAADTEAVAIGVGGNIAPTLDALGAYTVMATDRLAVELVAHDPNNDVIAYSVAPLPPGATLDEHNFSWAPTKAQIGDYVLVFTVIDGFGGADSEAVPVTVVPLTENRPPVLQNHVAIDAVTGRLVSFTVTATDPNDDRIVYAASPLPAGATFVDSTFAWTPSAEQTGEFDVTVTASDGHGGVDSDYIAILVRSALEEVPPVLHAIPDETISEGSYLKINVSATDANGDAMVFGASPLPAGAAFAGQSFTWRPAVGQAGEYHVTFTARDTYGEEDAATIRITVVTDPTALRAALSWSADAIVGNRATLHALDTLYVYLANTPSYKGAEIDLAWHGVGDAVPCFTHAGTFFPAGPGCGGLNRGQPLPIVTDDVPGHLHVAWANTAANAECSDGGNVVGVVFASDGCATAPATLTLRACTLLTAASLERAAIVAGAQVNVAGGADSLPAPPPNRRPVLAPIPAAAISPGLHLAFTIAASDPDRDRLAYSAAPLPEGATFLDSTFAWTPSDAQVGAYDITFVAADPLGAADSETVRVTVVPRNASPDFPPPSLRLLEVTATALTAHVMLDHAGPVELAVFDAAGARMGAAVRGDFAQGEHDLQLLLTDGRGRRVPGGVYLVRLSTAHGVETRRVVVVR